MNLQHMIFPVLDPTHFSGGFPVGKGGQGVLQHQLWKQKTLFMPGSGGFAPASLEEPLLEVSEQFRLSV